MRDAYYYFNFNFKFTFFSEIIYKKKTVYTTIVGDDYYDYGDLTADLKFINKIVQSQYKSYDRWIFFVICHPIFRSPTSLEKRYFRYSHNKPSHISTYLPTIYV